MSIKIDGANNIIKKETGSKVSVVPSLYLNGKQITGSGGGGGGGGSDPVVSSVSIKECDIYLKEKYATVSKIIVEVADTNWKSVTYDDTLNLWEININGEYYVSNLADYDGVVVTKKATEPEEPEVKAEMTVTFPAADEPSRNITITSSSYEDTAVDTDKIDFDDYIVSLSSDNFVIPWNSSNAETTDLGVTSLSISQNDWDGSPIEITSNTITTLGHNVTIKGTLSHNSDNKTFTFELSRDFSSDDIYFSFSLGVRNNPNLTITQTKKETTSSILSLRSTGVNSTPAESTTTVENLVVNNDALIQGNLEVAGCINDLSWYWENISINTTSTNIGMGFLAKVTDLTFQVNSEAITVPTLQLSPGSQYLTSNYSIAWTPQGSLIIDATSIANITGSIQILRYE